MLHVAEISFMGNLLVVLRFEQFYAVPPVWHSGLMVVYWARLWKEVSKLEDRWIPTKWKALTEQSYCKILLNSSLQQCATGLLCI